MYKGNRGAPPPQEEGLGEVIAYDCKRTKYIESLGYKEIRYQNRDVLNNIDGVMEDLARKLNVL